MSNMSDSQILKALPALGIRLPSTRPVDSSEALAFAGASAMSVDGFVVLEKGHSHSWGTPWSGTSELKEEP